MDSRTVLEKFEEHEKFQRLLARRYTFYRMIEHLEKFASGRIIETGCAHDADNWEGQGQSTLIWDWYVGLRPSYSAHSIDITQASIDASKAQTKNVSLICADSVSTLNGFLPNVLNETRLLYLDSFDWSPEANLDSAFHHMAELAAVWRELKPGCMIAVDDRHGDLKGKHFMVEEFMNKLGIKPAFKEYQIGWVKP